MPISLLPERTTLLLGSSVTISTPHSLVKELLDNAIDAEATSVDILLSPDTIEKIQVRDNGHGISVQDFEALGRRAHTSKLNTFEELQVKAGETLGFRGEALAAANSVCNLTIITRTISDPVGSRLQLKSCVGGAEDRRPLSAVVGTTVLATKLFENIPVRKQYLLKQRQKTVAGVKLLLQAYALARPYLKLSLKIQGDTPAAWFYTPPSPCTLKDTVLQIFGSDVAAVSMYVDSSTLLRDADIQMTGTMPRHDCGASALKPTRCFISVDARPLSSCRGIGKNLIGILKSHLRKVMSKSAEAHVPMDIIFQLDIRCVPGTYDPNASPAKDEVIFKDKQLVPNYFENLCKILYQLGKEPLTSAQNSSKSATRDVVSQINSTQPQALDFNSASNLTGNGYGHLLGSNNSAWGRSGITTSSFDLASHSAQPYSTQSNEDSRTSPAYPSSRLLTLPDVYNSSPRQHEPAGRTAHLLQSQSRDAQGTGQSGLVPARMRTKMRVDMSRKDSNTTEDEEAMELVDVEVPYLPLTTQVAIPPEPRASSLRGTIDNYFKSRRDDNFQIAVDHAPITNNPSHHEHLDSSSPLLPDQKPHTRQLQPLGDSVLNEIHNELERSDDVFGADLGELQHPNMSHRSVEVPTLQREPSTLDGEIRWVGRGGSRRGSTQFADIRWRQNHFSSSRPAAATPGLQTPPPSDPMQSQLANGPPPSSQRSENIITPFQGIQQASSYDELELPQPTNSTLRESAHAAQLSNQTQARSDMTELTYDAGFGTDNPGVGQGTVTDIARDMNRHIADKSQTVKMKQRQTASRRQRQVAAGTLGSQSTLVTNTPSRTQHYSHALQTMLMKTPPPQAMTASKPTLYNAIDTIETNEQSTPLLRRQLRIDNAQTPGAEVREDLRPSPIRIKESTERHELRQWHSLKNLPLERVPDDEQLQGIVTKAQLRMHQLKQLAHHTAQSASALANNVGDSPMYLNDMAQILALEVELEKVVMEWKKVAGLDFEVQFTLRNEAKGKRTAAVAF